MCTPARAKAGLIALFLAAPPGLAEDLAQPGTSWEGSVKLVEVEKGRPKFSSTDSRLVIRTRDGDKFSGEFWCATNSRGLAIEGSVDKKGTVRFKVTKEIRGEWRKDLVANAAFLGKLKDKEIAGRFGVPGNNARYGEIRVQLKE
jgi:hypothetical protein